MVSEGELLAQGYHDDQQRKLRELRYALAKCLCAIRRNASETDGYSDLDVEACEIAAPLLGIAWAWRPDTYGDPIYSMTPHPAEVAEKYQP